VDRYIAGLPAEQDADLMLCYQHGIAYQKDCTPGVEYDAAYYAKCQGYEDQAVALAINAGRIALVAKYRGIGQVVDIGIGSGEFVKKRPNTYGRDVNPVAIEWLKRNDLWADRLEEFEAFTFWDVIEHVPEPDVYFRQIPINAHVFVSIPVFDALDDIRKSRHYRPGEHLYHFEEYGFVNWMEWHGFLLLDHQTFEIDAGRDSIHSFAFKRFRGPQ
jgi:hypothetical protein